MLITRVATAIVGIPVVVAAVWVGGLPFWILAVIVALLAAREASGLLGLLTGSFPSNLASAGAVGLVVGAAFGSTALVAILAAILGLFLVGMLRPTSHNTRLAPTEGSLAVTSCLYAGLPIALLVLMRGWSDIGSPLPLPTSSPFATVPVGAAWVLGTVTATWGVDTVAYGVGRAIGRRPFSPRLSPRKTWEGTVAGVVAGSIVFGLWGPALGLAWPIAGCIGLLLAVAAVAGDLAESALKRAARAKDAGQLLPGHGGLLDRLDSLAFSTIVVFCSGVLLQSGHPIR